MGVRPPAAPAGSAAPAPSAPPLLTGEIEDEPLRSEPPTDPRTRRIAPGQPDDADAPADPVERLRARISERRDETVEILRTWLEEEERVS